MATQDISTAGGAGNLQHGLQMDMERDHSGQHSPLRAAGEPARRDYSHIQGWGVDLDHKNRPAHPMERTPPRLHGVHWDRPADQPLRMTVFHSTERPGVTPVFGTSAPPSGLSGMIRGAAYKLSENDIRHWLLLLVADRVNVVEGFGQDLMQGRLPNIFNEMGARAELRHNPAGFATKALVTTAILGGAYYLFRRRSERRRMY